MPVSTIAPMTDSSTCPESLLIVAIRGWVDEGDPFLFGRRGSEFPPEFETKVEAALPGARVFRPRLDMGMASARPPEALVDDLCRQIDAVVATMPALESILLVGYSSGSVLARRLFCKAHGMDRESLPEPEGPPAPEAVPWASKIDRVVVLSGVTRGWEMTSTSPAHLRFLAPALLWGLGLYVRCKARLARLLRRSRGGGRDGEPVEPLIEQLRRGAPFVIEARIQYVTALRRVRKRPNPGGELTPTRAALRQDGLPSTVFLLGAKDEYVSPADCTELGPRAEFVYLELPGSNHSEAIRVTDDDERSRERFERLLAALEQPYEQLTRSPWAVPSTDIDDYLDPMDLTGSGEAAPNRGEGVERVVMIVHGIRDHGFWTKRVAREVKRLGRKIGVEVRAPTPSYGYFSMWDFVMPGGRRRAAYWFLERYADVRTHFPNARISFVGHSNGTYIAARALQLSPAVHFENIVFAGSVVRRSFQWSGFRGRVGRVYNYVGHGDSVVAFLPAVFEELRLAWLDVGGAGAFGFGRRRGDPPEDRDPPVHQMHYVRGGHGAAIGEAHWPDLASFAVEGRVPEHPSVGRPAWLGALYGLAPAFTLLGVALAAVLLSLPVLVPVWLFTGIDASVWPAWMLFALVAVGVAVSWMTRRFLRQW